MDLLSVINIQRSVDKCQEQTIQRKKKRKMTNNHVEKSLKSQIIK